MPSAQNAPQLEAVVLAADEASSSGNSSRSPRIIPVEATVAALPITRVLLVDDDELAFQLVGLYLAEIQTDRYQVDWKPTYQEGLEALAREPYDVCLLDFQLGKHSGLDFLKESQRRGTRTPIVMFTSKGDHALDLEAMRAGAVDYLVKGEFGPLMLERCLRYATERARTMEALRESEERYVLAVAGANDGVWDWKLPGETVYFSPRWKAILGYGATELEDHVQEWYARVHPEDLSRLKADLAAHISGVTGHFENEHRILHKDGTYRWMLTRALAVRDRAGSVTRMAGSQSDVTQARGHDPLTRLPNRLLYLDRVARVLERAKRRVAYGYAVLFLDLDRFKIVNDSLGHALGDELLLGISGRLQACVRSADTVARLGGDEFTILLEDLGEPADATRVARRIQESLTHPFKLAGREVFTSVSIGIAMGSPNYERPEELLRDADTAMYRAKAAGKARHEVFDRDMHERAVKLLQVESELRRAVELESFRVHYQPVISLDTGRITSLEALVRWMHPERGLVPPDEFIPLAEETGLIVQIDRWVLQQACAQVKKWQTRFGPAHPLSIAVNVSKRQLGQSDFVDGIIGAIERCQLEPEHLSLEITESAIMENAELATAMLEQLRERKIQLAMDDFGTGYSSLSYLHKLPFTSLKIDRSFVKRMGADEDTTEIVRAIVTLARNLNVEVTAEGVETKEQLAMLRELGCNHAQGYLFSKPLETSAAEELLAREPVW